MSLQEVKQVVLKHRPILGTVLERYGNMSVFDYFQRIVLAERRPFNNERYETLLKTLQEKVVGLFGEDIIAGLHRELGSHYFASTAEHHGLISHPFFLNNTLGQALAQPTDKKIIISLSCGNVSLNNSSFPRGIFFHDSKLHEQRFHFFSGRYKHCPVFGLKAYGHEQQQRLQQELVKMKISTNTHERLIPVINNFFSSEVLAQSFFSDQLTLINERIWKLIPGQEHTRLIYVEQEEVVRRLLLSHHLHHSDIIHDILFIQSVRQLFVEHFENIVGAFNTNQQHGSFLFWSLYEGERKSLWYQDGHLVSADKKIKLSLEPDVIASGLEQRTLIPTMALSFIVLNFYYGLTCGGGFSQINYLGEMKQAYLALLQTAGYNEELSYVQAQVTDIFCGEFVLAVLASQHASTPASSLDMILYGQENTHQALSILAKEASLNSVVDAMMSEYYKIIVGTYPRMEHPILPRATLYV